jgi:hypothetical protein
MTLAGFAAAFAMDRAVLSEFTRRRIGTVLVVLAALAPLAGVGAMAASSRGLTGEVSHLWSQLTSTSGVVYDTPGRLTNIANSRGRYWSEAIQVGEHALISGVGAGGYGTARTRYTTDVYVVQHAHGYVAETFADFGLLGLFVNLALLGAWVAAVRRTVSKPAGADPALDPERAGLLTLLAIAVTFGVHSAIDWTWFVPGVAVPALVCAGWVAGRGPLPAVIGRVRRRALSEHPGRGAVLIGIAAAALLASWAIWQPLRSSNADAAAVAAASSGHTGAAIADERSAIAYDPVALEPLWDLSAMYSAIGDRKAAHDEVAKAVQIQPNNPQAWQQLGELDLQQHHLRAAVGALTRALALDLGSTGIKTDLEQAQSRLAAAVAKGQTRQR